MDALRNRGLLDPSTYEAKELNVGDILGKIDRNNVDYGMIRNMLGDESDGRINEFLDTQDFNDYGKLERDSIGVVADELETFKQDTELELRNEYRNNKPTVELGKQYKDAYDNIIKGKALDIEAKYPKVDFSKNGDIFEGVSMLKKFGASDADMQGMIKELQDKWQNKMYGR